MVIPNPETKLITYVANSVTDTTAHVAVSYFCGHATLNYGLLLSL